MALAPTIPRKRKPYVLTGLALATTCWFIISFDLIGFRSSQYVLVIDAGSSGTRMNAYTWKPSHSISSTSPIPVVLWPIPPDAAPHKIPRRALETRRAYKRVETEPGLDKFVNRIDQIGPNALAPLIAWARAVIPSSQWSSTPVFLLGTAGLRKLNQVDRENVLDQVRVVLSNSGFRFDDPMTWARVLGGSEEGVFAWVALNADLGLLGTKNTIGALDLGGSSLQITFAHDSGSHRKTGKSNDDNNNKNVYSNEDDAVEISVLGISHSLYTHSHYHFGLDDAFERSVSLVLDDQWQRQQHQNKTSTKGGVVDVDHPCVHNEYDQQYRRLPLYGKQPIPESVVLRGAWNAEACKRLVSTVIHSASNFLSTHSTEAKERCTKDSFSLTGDDNDNDKILCALGHPQPRPHSDSRFIGLAGFYVVSHFFNDGKGLEAVADAGRSFCPLSWREVQDRHQGELAVETYCFRSSYIRSLVLEGLGLQSDRVDIAQGTAGWTMGAALVEGHRLSGLQGSNIKRGNSNSAAFPWMTVGIRIAAAVLVLLVIVLVIAAHHDHFFLFKFLNGRGTAAGDAKWKRSGSSGILSAAEFGMSMSSNSNSGIFPHSLSQLLLGNGSVYAASSHAPFKDKKPSSFFHRVFGQPPLTTMTGSSSFDGSDHVRSSSIDSNNNKNNNNKDDEEVAVVESSATTTRGLLRSATVSRRLAAIEFD